MYTILLFAQTRQVREELTLALESWKARPLVLSVSTDIDPLNSGSAGLAVVELPEDQTAVEQQLTELTARLPWLPFLSVSRAAESVRETALDNGAEYCLSLPVEQEELVHHAEELLHQEGLGPVIGIPLHSCLQIMESEQTTCTLETSHTGRRGLLFLRNGTLIDAMCGPLSGEEAALEIMSWPEAPMQMRYFNDQRSLQIHRPGLELIMEALQKRSEKEVLHTGSEYAQKHQLPMKHFSTADQPIPLAPGEQVMVQLQSNAAPMAATFVGMHSQQVVITTNPLKGADCMALAGGSNRILIKFIHNGRAWMFKTALLQQVESAGELLLFAWPQVLHCHELRKARRTVIYVPSTFHFGNEKEFYGALIDLSIHGSLCRIKRRTGRSLPPLSSGAPMILHCLLPGIKEEQVIECRIRNLHTTDTHHLIGVEFDNLPSYLSNIITRYLYTQENRLEE